jgi:hypothetical protein
LDEKIQWLTEYKQYRTEADGVNVMLDETQKKLESCEKPTSNKAERDKQAAFLNVSFSDRVIQWKFIWFRSSYQFILCTEIYQREACK